MLRIKATCALFAFLFLPVEGQAHHVGDLPDLIKLADLSSKVDDRQTGQFLSPAIVSAGQQAAPQNSGQVFPVGEQTVQPVGKAVQPNEQAAQSNGEMAQLGGQTAPQSDQAASQNYRPNTVAVDSTHIAASRSGLSALREATPTVVKVAQTVGTTEGKTLAMRATAYGPSDVNWKNGGKTYSGTTVRQGVIAVDPNVIPIGTKVWISGYSNPNLPPDGFQAVAEDTGGKIRGNRIDIYIDTDAQGISQFGVQNVQVRMLN
ncbi:3D domain-containing protein [Effusibacillus dendaii]|uniref:3D domain-containing protein n=1 Tax=Effusibacillus dendaii TaxID=2743772 RepID=A0A7I8DF43_9BACL|nr:3D domain-containing protein [Effusibacillus dendaii]BCJ86531.1 hypothetical protein skT53_15160 [Effusibacillus dendaii]